MRKFLTDSLLHPNKSQTPPTTAIKQMVLQWMNICCQNTSNILNRWDITDVSCQYFQKVHAHRSNIADISLLRFHPPKLSKFLWVPTTSRHKMAIVLGEQHQIEHFHKVWLLSYKYCLQNLHACKVSFHAQQWLLSGQHVAVSHLKICRNFPG